MADFAKEVIGSLN